VQRALETLKGHWRVNTHKLGTLGPANVLKRGFAVLRNKDGMVIRNNGQVKVGETLEALLEEGKLKVNVQSIEDHWY
jgi:exodeoxyribonuclease VII large subunit